MKTLKISEEMLDPSWDDLVQWQIHQPMVKLWEQIQNSVWDRLLPMKIMIRENILE